MGEAMAPAEEAAEVAGLALAAAAGATIADADAEVDAAVSEPDAAGSDQEPVSTEPWSGLLRFGAQLAAALAAPDDGAAPAHPWIERDLATGARSLKLPLPGPEAGKRIADALALLADAFQRAGNKWSWSSIRLSRSDWRARPTLKTLSHVVPATARRMVGSRPRRPSSCA